LVLVVPTLMPLSLPTTDEIAAVVRRELEPVLRELAQLRRAAQDEAVTPAEAARRLGLSRRTVERRIRDGSLPSVRIGGARRVPLSAVMPRADPE
jgi:excisionase family DNA binding protein